jgi:OPA family glycerol-3-phosphate transporter-like MFS transporter
MGNRLVQSLGWAGAVKIVSRWFAFRTYGTVIALISLSYLFGDAVARQFMGALISQGVGWRGVFLAAAAVLALVLIGCAIWLRESPAEIGAPAPPVNPANLFRQAATPGQPGSLRHLLQPFLTSRVFWLACALSLGTTILRETFSLGTPTYFAQTTGMSAGEAASKSGLFPLSGGASVILCGWLSDRLGRGGRAALMLGKPGLFRSRPHGPRLRDGHGSRTWPVILVATVAFLILGPYSFFSRRCRPGFRRKTRERHRLRSDRRNRLSGRHHFRRLDG